MDKDKIKMIEEFITNKEMSNEQWRSCAENHLTEMLEQVKQANSELVEYKNKLEYIQKAAVTLVQETQKNGGL